MSRLISKEKTKIDFVVTLPKHLVDKLNPSIVRLKLIGDEYNYIPRKYTFGKDARFTVEELEAIIKKMKELNNDLKKCYNGESK